MSYVRCSFITGLYRKCLTQPLRYMIPFDAIFHDRVSYRCTPLESARDCVPNVNLSIVIGPVIAAAAIFLLFLPRLVIRLYVRS